MTLTSDELPKPWFSESVEDYARRCGRPAAEVREHWHRELVKAHAEQKARFYAEGFPGHPKPEEPT